MAWINAAPARLRNDTCSAVDAQKGGRHRRAVPTVGFVNVRDGSRTPYAPTIVDSAMTLTSLTLGNSNNLHVTPR
jgi:hypothetical protein